MTSSVSTPADTDKSGTVGGSDENKELTDEQQDGIFQKTVEKGAEEGLFRACMDGIHSAHKSANRLRAALVLSGLFTDKKIYREVITLFYVATNTMEKKMISLKEDEDDEICGKLLSLGYRFGPQYEKDLQNLYSDSANWKVEVENVVAKSSDAARAYIKSIESMTTGVEIAGATFCLWGALIIGGGAAARRWVESLCGKDTCNLFESVTGPGRNERKEKFIKMWDSLAIPTKDGTSDGLRRQKNEKEGKSLSSFEKIVSGCKECMQGNNELIISVQRNPWWLIYVASSAVAITAAIIVLISRYIPKAVVE